MNERALKTLEYDKIIEQLKRHAGSEMGKALCGQLKPQTDINTLQIRTSSSTTSPPRRHATSQRRQQQLA